MGDKIGQKIEGEECLQKAEHLKNRTPGNCAGIVPGAVDANKETILFH